MQILEIKKIKFSGSILDLGSKKSGSNVTNYINSNENIHDQEISMFIQEVGMFI